MALLRLAHVPPPSVTSEVSVQDAVQVMSGGGVGAVIVVKGSTLRGIFTERDLMLRVVAQGRDPRTTAVEEVMTMDVKTIADGASAERASAVMLEGHLRHLPVLDPEGRVLGLLSIRALLEDRLHDLSREISSLEQYMANDGPGG
jgi:CBS domain-containing protein